MKSETSKFIEKETHIELTDLSTKGKNDDGSRDQRLLFFKLVRKLMRACSQNKIYFKEIESLSKKYPILESIDVLKLLSNQEEKNYLATAENRNQFKNRLREELLEKFVKECDGEDRCFFAAAACNDSKLKTTIKSRYYEKELLSVPRYCDSILVFTFKYGDVSNKNFFECVNFLIDENVDVNIPDFNGKTAVEHVILLHKRSSDEEIRRKLETLIGKITKKRLLWEHLEDETKDFLNKLNQSGSRSFEDTQRQELGRKDTLNKLFCWIGREKVEDFTNFKNISEFADCDNGELTLLQFACKKSAKMHPVVKFLLDHGADPNASTKLYPLVPLEIAARRHNEKSFQDILKHKKLKISEDTFNNFVRWRSRSVKLKHFEMFLESDKLHPKFAHETSGNTPLHYAVRFSHKKAIQKILKRSEDLLHVENKAGRSALDTITVSDLQTHFDACLALDNYNDFGSEDYKMQLRFKSLISASNHKTDEVKVTSKISKHRNLQQLLTHPLIHIFLELKWFKVRFYYYLFLWLQIYLFLNLSIFFCLLKDFSSCTFWVCVVFTTLNCVAKLPFMTVSFFCSRWRWPTLYEILELVLVLTLLGAFFYVECRAFALVEMSILLLLTVGWHPKVAKWPVMLKQVFKTFSYLMLFFSLVLIAFAVAFHLLFVSADHQFFKTIWKSVFVTYVMVTGEFNMQENFNFSSMGGYVLFFLFAIFVALVMVNFWTGVAVTDISSIEKDADVNAAKNVITFLNFIESRSFGRKLASWMRLPNPSLFVEDTETDAKNRYGVDFYVNREMQFESRKDLKRNVGSECLDKIRTFCSNQMNSASEKRLEELEKICWEMKNAINEVKSLTAEIKTAVKGPSRKERK